MRRPHTNPPSPARQPALARQLEVAVGGAGRNLRLTCAEFLWLNDERLNVKKVKSDSYDLNLIKRRKQHTSL
jgi:hypothetical protein